MLFQTLDDKTECVGVYVDGKLHFDHIPQNLTKTWRFTGSVTDPQIKYAWLYSNGAEMEDVCPPSLLPELARIKKTYWAYQKSFEIARIPLTEFCFFDMVPQYFLLEYCEIKNKVTQNVFNNFEQPDNYDLLDSIDKLTHKIRYQKLNLNNEGCKNLYYSTFGRTTAAKFLSGSRYIDYNMFGTVTGRLTTNKKSFPILTCAKKFRRLIKPHNDVFLSLDYNGADVRTFYDLVGIPQPNVDVHDWNRKHLFSGQLTRDNAKIKFFKWLFNPDSKIVSDHKSLNREKLLDEWYEDGYINTPFKRKMQVDKRKALSYLIQSSTNDRVLTRAIEIDSFLQHHKSFISHLVHDEVVIDLHESEKHLIPSIINIFEKDKYKTNVKIGENYLDLEEVKF